MATIIINHLLVQGPQQVVKAFVDWSHLNQEQFNNGHSFEFEPSHDHLHHKGFIDFMMKLTGIKVDRIRLSSKGEEQIFIAMDSWNCYLGTVVVWMAKEFPELKVRLTFMQHAQSHQELILENGKWCLLNHETPYPADVSSWETSICAAGFYDDYSDSVAVGEQKTIDLSPALRDFACSQFIQSKKRISEIGDEYDDETLNSMFAKNQWPDASSDGEPS